MILPFVTLPNIYPTQPRSHFVDKALEVICHRDEGIEEENKKYEEAYVIASKVLKELQSDKVFDLIMQATALRRRCGVSMALTREDVVDILGEPDDVGKTPRIWVAQYGECELWFELRKSGRLCSVWGDNMRRELSFSFRD